VKSGAKQVSKKTTAAKKAPVKHPGKVIASSKAAPEAASSKKGFAKSSSKPNIVAKPVVMNKPRLVSKSDVMSQPNAKSPDVKTSVAKLSMAKPSAAKALDSKPSSAKLSVAKSPNSTTKTSVTAKGSAETTVAKTPKAIIKPKPPAPPLEHRPAPITSVPTNGKPRKNQAVLSWRELETFRALLLSKRHELVGDVFSMERDALHASGGSNLSNLPLHMADMGTDNYEQEFTLGLMEKDRKLLKEINLALAKIQDGRYGICEGTGQPISKVRLEAQPWARFSIDYARKMEHGGVGAGRVSRDFNRATDT
jgi:RNA polymerase-binding transcription factor